MKKIIITAGGTSEKIDDVRKITNSSSGRLGMIIANHLKSNKEYYIYYICSKTALQPKGNNIKIIEIEDTEDLKEKVEFLLTNDRIDFFIHSMAVSDYTVDYITTLELIRESLNNLNDSINNEMLSNVKRINDSKISSYENNLVLVLKPTPKIISMIKKLSPKTFLIGFKLLMNVSKDYLIDVAKGLRDKNDCDLVVANDLKTIRNGEHIAFLIDKNDDVEEAVGKDDIAKKLVKIIKKNS